jgi:hypothetical protein
MLNRALFWISILAVFGNALAEEPPGKGDEGDVPVVEGSAKQVDEDEIVAELEARANPAQPKTMSGMSILGNEEAPKALVIVPWKSSELGADLELSDTLDDRARPVDREVFMRELSYYELRSGNQER